MIRRSPMRARSVKRAAQERIYRKLRDEFLAEHRFCQSPRHPDGMAPPSVVLHHRRGRRGARLLDVTWWAASCHECNQWAEDASGEALACGWLVRVEGVA